MSTKMPVKKVIEIENRISLMPITYGDLQSIHTVFGKKIAHQTGQHHHIKVTGAFVLDVIKRFTGKNGTAYVARSHQNNKMVSLLLLCHESEVLTVEVWYALDVEENEKLAILKGARYYGEQTEGIKKILFNVNKRDYKFKELLSTSLSAEIQPYTVVYSAPTGGFIETSNAVISL